MENALREDPEFKTFVQRADDNIFEAQEAKMKKDSGGGASSSRSGPRDGQGDAGSGATTSAAHDGDHMARGEGGPSRSEKAEQVRWHDGTAPKRPAEPEVDGQEPAAKRTRTEVS